MFNKIKDFIKKLEFKKKYFLLETTKILFFIATCISICVILTNIDIIDLFSIERSTIIGSLTVLLLSILTGIFDGVISLVVYIKLSRYFLSFYTDEEIIKNINYFYFEDKGRINHQFVNLYKEKKEIFFLNFKEITEKLGKNWVVLTKIDVRKLLINKDVKWYSNQISKIEFYNYCSKTIEEIIEKEEKEYYHIILELFNDFIEEEKILKMKNQLKKENVVSIIQI